MRDPDQRFNPFPGLRAFQPDEEHLFFGRERQVDELLRRLRQTRLLSVVGTSGSGKSSLVMSGLIPALHGGFMVQAGSRWRVAIFRPGDDPIGNLAAALNAPEVLGGEEEIADINRAILETTLRRGALGLAECVRQARARASGLPESDNLLIVADQFEELFRFKRSSRLKDSGDQAVAFIKLLLEAASRKELPIYIVLTMRTDFLENCDEFPGLPEAINNGAYLVPRMNRDERRAAITGPVAVGGAEIGQHLVARLLNDVGDDPDQLPILQHALMRTWDRWERDGTGGPVDLEHYSAVGTMEQALSQHAEEAFAELASEHEREIAEQMFKALTDKGPDRRGVRRPIQLKEVCALTGAGEDEVVAVVERFRRPGRSFLMPPAQVPLSGDSMLDISHESLMRVWTRLIGWVDEETRSAQFYLRLAKASRRYEEGAAGLWRDPELEFALQWQEENRPTAVWAQRYDPAFDRAMSFLRDSKKQRDSERAAQELERKKKLRRARRLAAVFGLVSLLTLALAGFALQQRNRAQENAAEARKQQQVAQEQERMAQESARQADAERQRAELERQAAEEAKGKAEEQRQMALEQKSIADEQRTRAQAKEQEARLQKDRAEAARLAAVSAQQEAQQQRAAAEQATEQAVISEREARRLRILELAQALAIRSPRLQEEGQQQLAALLAVQAYRLNLDHGGQSDAADVYLGMWQTLKQLDSGPGRPFGRQPDAVRALSVAPDGLSVATGSDDGSVRLLDLNAPQSEAETLLSGGSEIRAVAHSPSGRRLAAAAFDGSIAVWELSQPAGPTWALGPPVDGANGEAPEARAISALVFRDEAHLASGSLGGEVTLWDLGQPASPTVLLAGHSHRILSLAFSPDGETLAAASGGGGALLFSLAQGAAEPRVLLAGEDLRSIAWSRDGRLLACGHAGGVITVLETANGSAGEPLQGHTAGVQALSFGPDRDLLASASTDGTLRLWNLDLPDADPIVLDDHDGWVWTVAFSPDGNRVVSGGSDRQLGVWTTRASLLAEKICSIVPRQLTAEEWSRYVSDDLEYQTTCPDRS